MTSDERSVETSESRTDAYLGIDIGKTRFTVAAVSPTGSIYDKRSAPTDVAAGGPNIIARVKDLARAVIGQHRTIRGIGIGASGIVDHERGVIITSGSIPGWRQLPIAKMFREEFSVPVHVDNDVHAAGLGESLFGAGRTHHTIVYLTISTGVGFCVVSDKKLWRGRHGLAGQVAHLELFGHHVTVNSAIAGKGIEEQARQRLGRSISAREVFEEAERGEPVAKHIVDSAIESASVLVAWIQNTVDPDIVVVGGAVAINQPSFVGSIRRQAGIHLEKYSTQLGEGPDLQVTALGGEAGVLGSAALSFSVQGDDNP